MLITRSTYLLFPKPSATSHDLPQWMKLLKHPVIQVSGICDENIFCQDAILWFVEPIY